VLPHIADASIDMLLVDLPYGTTQNKWDSVLDLEQLWQHYNRVVKPNGAMVFTASQPFTSALGASNIDNLRYSWVWVKNYVTGHLNAHRMPMKNYEDVLVFYRKQPTYNPQGLIPYQKIKRRGHNGTNYGVSGAENYQEWTNYPRLVLHFDRDEPSLHPTQKPVKLFEYLIATYTNPGEIVLDTCSGSATSCIASLNLDRNYIAIELDPKYHAIASERIATKKAGK
jgi:site-specific DNA-methyltransferase (adenine-specific)